MTSEFLNTGKAFSITKQDKKEIFDMMQSYAQAVPGAKVDTSVLKMRERTASGELLPEKKETAKTSLLASKLKQKGR